MKAAIMQPYFAPYLGYFQLIRAVDVFVVYDNIEYTKAGWINRNRILLEGRETLVTIPLEKASDFCMVNERFVSPQYLRHREKILAQIRCGYRKAACFARAYPLVESIVRCEHRNLFDFIHHSIRLLCDYLDIRTKIVVSSALPADHGLRAAEKVISLCRCVGADEYINPAGGRQLYREEEFAARGIALYFHEMLPYSYPQFSEVFVPRLSILDVIMHNGPGQLALMLDQYVLAGRKIINYYEYDK